MILGIVFVSELTQGECFHLPVTILVREFAVCLVVEKHP